MIKNNQKGYIAIISAIIITVLLLAITLSLGFSSIFNRFDILDSESKERSTALAESCGEIAILEATGGIYSQNKPLNIGGETCTIVSSATTSNQVIIKTRAEVNKAFTNLKFIISTSTFDIISWEECATPCI